MTSTNDILDTGNVNRLFKHLHTHKSHTEQSVLKHVSRLIKHLHINVTFYSDSRKLIDFINIMTKKTSAIET